MASWYLELAAGEALDPKRVVISLAKAIQPQLAKQDKLLHMGQLSSLAEPLLTVKEVADFLNVSEETVRRYARDRVLTTVDIPGGAIRFHPKTLLDELNSFLRPSKFSA
jgi:excisionase family DNA binding protein